VASRKLRQATVACSFLAGNGVDGLTACEGTSSRRRARAAIPARLSGGRELRRLIVASGIGTAPDPSYRECSD
jgi:hypothetical protein